MTMYITCTQACTSVFLLNCVLKENQTIDNKVKGLEIRDGRGYVYAQFIYTL